MKKWEIHIKKSRVEERERRKVEERRVRKRDKCENVKESIIWKEGNKEKRRAKRKETR